MATPKHGRRGRVYIDSTAGGTGTAAPVSLLNSWSVDGTADRVEVTAFGDSNKRYVQGLSDASGSFGGFYDADSGLLYNVTDGAERKFYLYPSNDDDTSYWHGKVFLDVSTSGGVNDAVTRTFNWQAASDIIWKET